MSSMLLDAILRRLLQVHLAWLQGHTFVGLKSAGKV